MERISRLCPRLTKIKVLMSDLDLRYFEMFPSLEEVPIAFLSWKFHMFGRLRLT